MATELQEYKVRVLADPIRSNNRTQFLVRIDGKDYQVIEDGIQGELDYLFLRKGTQIYPSELCLLQNGQISTKKQS